jgi:hypothetical protein
VQIAWAVARLMPFHSLPHSLQYCHMKRTYTMKRSFSLLGGISLLVTSTLVVCNSPASAIPGSRSRCAFNVANFEGGAADAPIPDLSVSVNNTGTNIRRAIVQLSADTCVPAGGEVRVSYALDDAAPQVFGPANFANNQPFCETHTTIAVIPIPPGRHSIRPFARFQGTGTAAMISRCVTVELNTN